MHTLTLQSSSSPCSSSLSLLSHGRPLSLHHHPTLFLISPVAFLSPHRHRRSLRISAAVAENTDISDRDELSWFFPDDPALDSFNGWASFRPASIPKKTAGFRTFLVAGIGSIAAVLAALAFFSRTNNGFRLPFRTSFPSLSVPFVAETREIQTADSDAPREESEDVIIPSIDEAESSDALGESMASEDHQSEFRGKLQPRIINVTVDSIQEEALNVLKKLKIVDENVKAGQLCTRREYARWLVRAGSLLERNPKYKITKAVALAGSVISAFEDVDKSDQDFDSIQALAEAGVVSSKLSSMYNSDNGDVYFYPERFLSRRDLIDWRAQVEYDFAITANQEILKTKLSLMDVKEISLDKWPGLFMDMLAGDKSLLRRVFGQIKRLEPNKPSTVAQASVALTSGRMTEAINVELSRIEAEESSRQAAKEEIKKELLDRGEIQSFWAQKMEEVKEYGLKVQQIYMDALKELEEEKIVQEVVLSGYLKEKAAMECQKQLLNALTEEIHEMSEKIVADRTALIAEEEMLQTVSQDLQAKMEGILDAKSLLDAEIEALRILRSWIEDEAKKSQARWKVLEQVGRRWRWDGQ